MRRATSAVTRPINEPKPKPSRPVFKARPNWAGVALVCVFCAVFAVALTLFVIYSGDPTQANVPGSDPGTEDQPPRRNSQSDRPAADGTAE